ncbi:MAG: phosphoribosylformylglycinamidine cyclo-ligase [Myxococcales bacterium]|nr:phosphoribosylformylglycinamidine cyclo-ligase [Myxococcales bacterium]
MDAYRRAGVDIAAGEALVDRIKGAATRTHRPGVMGGLGGFGGLFSLAGYTDPVLVSGTDGVGTKLLVAQQLGRHDTVGIDLVAMCVNDVVVSGAEPLFFLDYFATGALDVDAAAEVVEGIARGCELAGCALLGGETAEMPGMYGPGHYDLAGFCVGVVERDQLMDPTSVSVGDALVGLPSSGLHSNGFSLVRQVLLESGAHDLDSDPAELGHSLGDELMLPTRIYVRDVLDLRQRFEVRAMAHITGGGLPGNVARVLPDGCGAELWRGSWPVPDIFALLATTGSLSEADMTETFNCGIGMVLVVPQPLAEEVAAAAEGHVIGRVIEGDGVSFT